MRPNSRVMKNRIFFKARGTRFREEIVFLELFLKVGLMPFFSKFFSLLWGQFVISPTCVLLFMKHDSRFAVLKAKFWKKFFPHLYGLTYQRTHCCSKSQIMTNWQARWTEQNGIERFFILFFRQDCIMSPKVNWAVFNEGPSDSLNFQI